MTEIGLSLFVLAGISVLVLTVLLLSRRAAQNRETALAAYCAKNGFHLEIIKEPTARSIRIVAKDWRLTGSMRASENAAQTGSSDWERKTEWICTRQNPLRPVFALQVFSGATELERLPDWVREAALAAMRRWLGDALRDLSSMRTVFCENGRCGVLFEPEKRSADRAMERLYAPLSAWRGNLPLYLESAPDCARLTLANVAFRDAKEAEAILQIGLALL